MKKILLTSACFLCFAVLAVAQSKERTAQTPVPLAATAEVSTPGAQQVVTANAQVNAVGMQMNAEAVQPALSAEPKKQPVPPQNNKKGPGNRTQSTGSQK